MYRCVCTCVSLYRFAVIPAGWYLCPVVIPPLCSMSRAVCSRLALSDSATTYWSDPPGRRTAAHVTSAQTHTRTHICIHMTSSRQDALNDNDHFHPRIESKVMHTSTLNYWFAIPNCGFRCVIEVADSCDNSYKRTLHSIELFVFMMPAPRAPQGSHSSNSPSEDGWGHAIANTSTLAGTPWAI